MVERKNYLDDYKNIADDLIKAALKKGADEAEVVLASNISMSYECRLGKVEEMERAESQDLGLRLIRHKRQAFVSSSNWHRDELNMLLDRAWAMSNCLPEDEYCGGACPSQLGQEYDKDLESFDKDEPSPDDLQRRADEAEQTALNIKGITNSDGASASWSQSYAYVAGSNGLSISHASTDHSVGVSVIAGAGLAMQQDYDYSLAVFGSDLQSGTELGRHAAEKTLAKLNPKKVASGEFPVLFDPLVSPSFIGTLAGAINGASIARGTSFLKDKLGKKIMPDGVNIIDDPHRIRGLGSRKIDSEGLSNHKTYLVKDGVLQTWLLTLASARQLNLPPTGHAGRGVASLPSATTSNLYLENGGVSREEMIKSVKKGVLVTSLMGMGVNGVTGDYSQGAEGFWIENGEIQYPVSEFTIADNLLNMFLHMHVADDLRFKRRVNAPTIMVDKMTVAGT